MRNLPRNPKIALKKIGKKNPVTLRILYCRRRNNFAIRALLCNTLYFYIVDNEVLLHGAYTAHWRVSIATMVTRTRHVVTLCVECVAYLVLRYRLTHRLQCYSVASRFGFRIRNSSVVKLTRNLKFIGPCIIVIVEK